MMIMLGAKGDWDFRISDLVKNLKERYLTSAVNFGEVWRAQFAKSPLLTYTLVPLGFFQVFQICSDAKVTMRCGKKREATAPIHP